METYNNGAKRSDSKPFYREIPLCALRREGEALRLGAEKYNEQVWESNWRKGDTEYALSCLDHAFEHLQKLSENYKARLCGLEEPWGDEDHLGHLRANTAFLARFEEQGRFDPPQKEETVGYDALRVLSEESLRGPFRGSTKELDTADIIVTGNNAGDIRIDSRTELAPETESALKRFFKSWGSPAT